MSKSSEPRILLGETEHQTLLSLARSGRGEALLVELERARIVPDRKVPDDAVRMGARVTYLADGRREVTVRLVYPAEADIAEGRISVLTPVGTALLGLRPGQSIAFEAPDGSERSLTVKSVEAGSLKALPCPRGPGAPK
ncbi:nucleoside diphosphate kinase regulator [Arsenicitalea aurantiaca]|uniref:Nucleoside diphosphate kinase regulator n=1 Tax=Arsenicitalea aurantiaca TaxID=1783274 RepID=A0A433X880_9HYPH|nr:nucleoside diphosphate kinase regulator [Arsenicitalea aurantiaca]RUT30297.1 nucleoside diphosphate kinase regulator [Arsenicitalea aurantiaca]